MLLKGLNWSDLFSGLVGALAESDRLERSAVPREEQRELKFDSDPAQLGASNYKAVLAQSK